MTYIPSLSSHVISAGNSTTALLGASATFTGQWEDVTDYTTVAVAIFGDNQTDGTLYIESSQDGGVTVNSVPFAVADASFDLPHIWNVVESHIRVRYVNGSTAQTGHFQLQTKYSNAQSLGLLQNAGDTITANTDVQIVKSVLTGQSPTGDFKNVPVDSEGNMYIHLQRPTSAFGDLRSVELTPQAQVTFPYNINTDIVDIEELNGGTVTQANSMAVLQTSTATNGEATLKSRQILKYRAGLGGLARFTGLFTTGVASSEQIIGIGDDEDGYFFGYVGTAFGIIIRKNGVDEFIPQTSWNVDNMDGGDGPSNPSNMLLDPTKLNVFEIDFQWLGAGQIDFHIEDPIPGHFTPVHRVKYANNNTDPSLFNPSFPLHANIKNTGNATNLTMKTASMAAFCEGKSIVNGPRRSFGNLKAISTELALFSLQNKSTFQTKTNRISSFIKTLSVGNDINQLAIIKIYRNTTLGGTPAFTDINTANSPIQSDVAGTTVTGGDLLYEFVVGKDSGADFTFNIPDLDMRPGDIITFTASSGGAGDVSASVSWIEDQ